MPKYLLYGLAITVAFLVGGIAGAVSFLWYHDTWRSPLLNDAVKKLEAGVFGPGVALRQKIDVPFPIAVASVDGDKEDFWSTAVYRDGRQLLITHNYNGKIYAAFSIDKDRSRKSMCHFCDYELLRQHVDLMKKRQ